MSTFLSSTVVVAGQTATAVQYNRLRLDVIQNAGDYGITTGDGNVYALSIDPQISSYTAGQKFRMKANFTNTATATLAVNSLAATSLVNDGSKALKSGDIVSGEVYEVTYDGTNFQLLNQNNFNQNLFATTTAVSVASTNAAIGLFTGTVVAGSLQTGNLVHVRLNCSSISLLQNRNFTMIFAYGGTTVVSVNPVAPNIDTIGVSGFIDLYLFAAGSTGAQKGYLSMIGLSNGASTGNSGANNVYTICENASGTCSVDSTVNKNITLSIQFSISDASNAITVDMAYMEVIKS